MYISGHLIIRCIYIWYLPSATILLVIPWESTIHIICMICRRRKVHTYDMYVGLKTNNGGRGALFAKIKLLLRLPRLYVSGGHKGLGGGSVPKLYPSTIKNTKFLNGYIWTPKARHYLGVFGFLRGRIHEGRGGGANSMYVYVYAQTRFRPKRYNYVLYCMYICEPYYLSICVRCAILFVIPMYLLHCRRLVFRQLRTL